VLGVLLRGCVFRPAAQLPGSSYNRGTNAVWLGIEWVNEPHDAREIAALADRLQALQVRDVYVYVSYLRPNGRFGETYTHAAELTRAMKAAAPSMRLHAWLGVPVAPRHRSRLSPSGYVDIGDAAVRHTIATFAAGARVEGGFDGIHLDAEPAVNGDPDLLSLLDDVRSAAGRGAVLSIAAPRIWPVGTPSPPGFVMWTAGYYRQVAQRVDQVAVMNYDTALPLPWLYRLWSQYQVIAHVRPHTAL
jgi:hypothetical protein